MKAFTVTQAEQNAIDTYTANPLAYIDAKYHALWQELNPLDQIGFKIARAKPLQSLKDDDAKN